MQIISKIWLLLLFSCGQLQAAPMAENEVPEPLKPWVDWVLYEQEEFACPHAYNTSQRFCAWPSTLELALNNTQGAFTQQWLVNSSAWVRLPGNDKQWPQEVMRNGVPIVVVEREGFPAVQLSAGQHEISGSFHWDSIPESLTIPPRTGLLKINRDGEEIAFPRINQQGQLWLDKSLQEKDVQDSQDVQVYRKIQDSQPLHVETRLILNVSGRSRDVVFPGIQLEGFIPLSLNSHLPARVNQQGDLHVQVRPGNWEINLISYHPEMVDALTLVRSSEQLLPAQEVWVFQANPALRLAEISGTPAIDSRQTRVPKDWQRFPAYLVDAGQTMQIKTLQRGSASPEPNRLSLKRRMWMDFDGKGYTIKDAVSGTMTKGWRLVVSPEIALGSVRIDGEPQFITVLAKGENKGVEVRRGQIALDAESRYTQSLSELPVTGWQHDFQKVSTQLYLPPGWSLFSAHGADNLPKTWLQSWTLLDLFLVLIIAVAMGRLWGWKWGVFALLTMALIWHEVGAPKLIWLNLLAAIAVLRVLPEGLFKKLVWWYRNATLLVLVLMMIPFVISEVKNALYPQLGLYADYDSPSHHRGVSSMVMEESFEIADVVSSPVNESGRYDKALKKMPRMNQPPIQQNKHSVNQMVDPNANIQTGPGLPSWDWQQVHFQWHSPVNEAQTLRLNLLSPGMNMMLNILRVLLLVVLIGRLLGEVSNIAKPGGLGTQMVSLAKRSSMLLLPIFLSMMWHEPVYAENVVSPAFVPVAQTIRADELSATHVGFPTFELLHTLRERLLAQSDCLPACAQIATMQMQVSEQQLMLYLKVHVSAEVAIPLPGQSAQWRPEHVLIANEQVERLSRDENGNLWLGLSEGIHDVVMQGRLPTLPQLQLSLPLLPKSVSWEGTGWIVEGIRENHRPSQQLQLIRTQEAMASQGEPVALSDSNTLPPLLRVERTLRLGLDWLVETKVTRLSPVGSPISMKIPLLMNESVMTNAFPVTDGHALINFSSMLRTVSWQSQIPVAEQLQLEATRTQGLVESWKLDISPIWHVQIEGVPTIHQSNQHDVWLPEWRPWPGEKVVLSISRPTGIEGRTLTIDRSILSTSVGKRLRETTLVLNVRSSRGGQHIIRLPQNAELVSVTINDKVQPVRQQQGQVSLPIVPGQQRIEMKWRVSRPISTHLQVLPVDVGVDNVNNSIHLRMGRDRWILLTNGPQMGPAVLFWGVLLVVLLGALMLGRIKDSPLRTWQWFLLGVGLSLATPLMIIVVVTWLLAIKYRPQLQDLPGRWVFNISQVLLVLLTLAALGSLLITLQQGLLGWPDMQIRGNQSSAWVLRWYQDRADALLPQPWVVSVPLIVYRLFMLLWALWLAFSLISWLKQGWENFTVGGFWRSKAAKVDTKPASEVVEGGAKE